MHDLRPLAGFPRPHANLRTAPPEGGQYMFTRDWYGHEDAAEAGDGGHKRSHVIALDNGNFAAQPNNRMVRSSLHHAVR